LNFEFDFEFDIKAGHHLLAQRADRTVSGTTPNTLG